MHKLLTTKQAELVVIELNLLRKATAEDESKAYLIKSAEAAAKAAAEAGEAAYKAKQASQQQSGC